MSFSLSDGVARLVLFGAYRNDLSIAEKEVMVKFMIAFDKEIYVYLLDSKMSLGHMVAKQFWIIWVFQKLAPYACIVVLFPRFMSKLIFDYMYNNWEEKLKNLTMGKISLIYRLASFGMQMIAICD